MKNKVPLVTLGFWIIKILATTLGETGGDAFSMTLQLGYAVSTEIFFAFLLVSATAQIAASKLHRFLYWAVIVATTMVGTTTSDYLTRTAGQGYLWTSVILFVGVLAILAIWYFSLGSVNVNEITNRKAETFYWLTILTSNTLGTALGDCLADDTRLGYEGGALVFGGAIAVIALIYFFTKISHVILFWTTFVLTRPLGATLGDTLTKPVAHGGLNLGRFQSSGMILVVMVVLIFFASRKSEDDARPTAPV